MEKTSRVSDECNPSGYEGPSVRDYEESRIAEEKKKEVVVDGELVILNLKVCRVEGIENFIHYPHVLNRYYSVVCWVEPGEEVRTAIVEGMNPQWNANGAILLENPDDDAFLNVEVLRFNSAVDPGTSCGRVVVGRTKIPLPMYFDHDEVGAFELVRNEGGSLKLDGIIVIAMRLERIWRI